MSSATQPTNPAAADKPFAGKIALVTGGTQGLGLACASLLAAEGAAGIVLCGRSRARGKAAAEKLAAFGARVAFVEADLAEMADCAKVIARTQEAFGTCDILVNAAGATDRGTILDTTPELFDRIMAVNLRAPFFLMQGVIRMMVRDRKGGAIVNILSMSSHGGQPFLSAYSTSKGALATLTRNVAYSVMRNRIRVNGLNIGWMDSPGEHQIQTGFHSAPEDWLKQAEAKQPIGRLLKTDEVARTVAFLCGPDSGLMTGSLIDFDQSVLGAYEDAPHPARAMTL
jgi:NAD(P)-dependent dehydrogenase (short-subunit alcohol dehydrogenase family)